MAGKPGGIPEDRPIPTGYLPSLGTGRKRRRDALPPGTKPDYHKRDAVLSVRVDDALAEWVKGQAEAEGMSVNSWLRNLLENLRSRS